MNFRHPCFIQCNQLEMHQDSIVLSRLSKLKFVHFFSDMLYFFWENFLICFFILSVVSKRNNKNMFPEKSQASSRLHFYWMWLNLRLVYITEKSNQQLMEPSIFWQIGKEEINPFPRIQKLYLALYLKIQFWMMISFL